MNSTSVLDPMPYSELMGSPLDLRRPELQGLMERYCSKAHETQATLVEPQTALIVTRNPGEETRLKEALEDEGWLVKTCAGPGTGNCPIMHGARCELRTSADAALVFVDANEFSGTLGTIPRLRCAADSSSPGVVVIEGSAEPPNFLGRSATVGALRDARVILRTVKSLLSRKG